MSCVNCGSDGPTAKTEAEAETAWNTRAALAAPTSPWLPISSAPKDGTRLWLYFPLFAGSSHQEAGYWDVQKYHDKPKPFWNGDGERTYGILHYRKYPPSHYKPLPAGPVEQGAQP